MSTPPNLNHLIPLIDAPDAAFDAFWQANVEANPQLGTPGHLEMPVESYRKMLKLAFLAGKFAQVDQILSE